MVLSTEARSERPARGDDTPDRAGETSMIDNASAGLETTGTDGSIEPDEQIRAPVAGGVLVYEDRYLGRELVGFEDVTDWDDLRTALAARGHGTGGIHHLSELDGEEGR